MGEAQLTARPTPDDGRPGVLHLGAAAHRDWITSPWVDEEIAGAEGVRLVVVGDGSSPTSEVALPPPGALPVVVCWLGETFGGDGPDGVDLVVGPDDLDDLVEAVTTHPLSATALAVLLRSQAGRDREAGLAAESAVYSTLQAGPEFDAWRHAHPAAPVEDAGPLVVTDRLGDTLRVVLDRPARHNAISTRLRDELAAALAVALADPSIERVELSGNGPSFCSGGDLDEFGARSDPATAHATRLARSPGRLVDRLGNVHATVHGTTLGGGIETAAFAAHVAAHPATVFGLPEIGLGLIPGAGGTVSLTRRVGARRTAALGLTGRRIDAPTALAWGLIDEILGDD